MKPLYKFILDKETFRISVIEVTDYEECKWVTREKYWKYKTDCWHFCYAKDIDRFKNHHVYSFNPDINHAKDIMIEAISERLIASQVEVERWSKALNEIHIEQESEE